MNIRAARRMEGVERTLIRRIFDSAPPDAINLGLGQPDLPTPSGVCLAGVAAIAEGRTGYTSTAGDPELRAALASRYPSLEAGPESVLVTVGSQEALFVCCLVLANPGDEVLFPDPGYPAYAVVPRLVGARAVPYPLRAERAFRPDPDDIVDRLTDRTALVVLSAPSNPTGACFAPRDLSMLCAALEQRQVPWISDEIYAGFTFEHEFVSPLQIAPDGGLVVGGLSKDASMTGWRIGWVAGAPSIVSRLVAAHQYLVTCASSISQRAALATFTERGRAELRGYRELFRGRRELMAQALRNVPNVRFAKPDGAFYYFVDVSDHGSSTEIARRLLERRRVVTIPGEAFGERGGGWLRISFAASEQDIRQGIAALAAELSDPR